MNKIKDKITIIFGYVIGILFLYMLSITDAGSADQSFTILDFGGKVTTIAPDKIPDRNSPDLLNGYTDDGGMFTKRRGTTKYNSSTYEGLKPIRAMFVYPLNSITSYLTVLSSTSWSYILNGVPTTITNGLTISALDDYAIAKGLLYRDNGVDGLGGKWDGTTYTSFEVPTLSSISVLSATISTTTLATAVGTSSTTGNYTAWSTPTLLRVSLDTTATGYAYCNTRITGYNENNVLTTEVVISTIGMEKVTSNYFYSVSTITWYSLIEDEEFRLDNRFHNIQVNVGKYTYQMVSGAYIKYWNNRLWKIAKNSNIAYYSKINAPDAFDQNYQYVNINVNDGDIVTGMMIWNDRLIITKKYAVYEIYESQPGVFLIRRLYNGIGCLYNTTMDVQSNGLPVWLSHRGAEEFTGNSFNLLSESNDEYFKALPQLGDATLSYTDTTKTQWDAGVGIGIDTTTVTDSFIVRLSTRIDQRNSLSPTIVYSNTGAWQEFQTSNTARLSYIEVRGSYLGTFILSSGNIVGAGYSVTAPYSTTNIDALLNYYPYDITLTSGVTYRITHTHAFGSSNLQGDTVALYPRGESSTAGADWYFRVYLVSPASATYTSAATNVNSLGLNTWTSWNSLNVSCNIPGGAAYYIRVATTAVNLTAAPYTAVGNGNLINLTTGPFIQYKVEMTSTTTQIDDITITASGESSKPSGKVYNRRYWLAVTTNTATWANSVVMCYQKNNEWTQFNNMNISCMAIMKNELYYGDSTATGQIYKTDAAGIWQDNGTNYNSYWRSKIFDFGGPMSEKLYKTLWVYAEPVNAGDQINVKYALNGTDTFINKVFPTYALGQTAMEKIQFPAWTKGKQIQFEIGDNDNHDFRFKRLDLLYSGLMPR